jgi:hypothetical protein
MSFSDFSDLSDISSDGDDEYLSQPTRPNRTKGAKPKRDYQITNVLRPPRVVQYTAKSLYGVYHRRFALLASVLHVRCATQPQNKLWRTPLGWTRNINEVRRYSPIVTDLPVGFRTGDEADWLTPALKFIRCSCFPLATPPR